MKIVVTTPAGNIGSKLTNILLDRGADVTLIARNLEKVKEFAARGARVIAGSHDQADVVESAIQGADALFWLTPGNYASTDPLGDARHFADEGAKVIRKYPKLHVVQLSSVGAHRPDGTGPILGLHMTEERFRAVGKNITSLRPNLFMENIFNSLPTIVRDGAIYTTAPGKTSSPQVATQDIAEIAAEFLMAPPAGYRIVDIVGPDNFTYDEMAAILTRATGRTIRIATIHGEALKQGLKQAGISEEMAELVVEMEESFAAGLPHDLRGDEKRTGKVGYEEFVHDTFLPAYEDANSMARAS